VKLLGFTDRSSISRHHFMKDVCLFVPKPGNKEAALAVSAIARAMGQMNKVAIVQCVWRHDQGNVALGVLTPNISSENNVQDSFYFNVLPFAKDIGKFQFPSFSRLPSLSQPTEEQQKAADNFVSMLNLAPSGREVLEPEFTPNPMLEVLFFVVEHHVECFYTRLYDHLIFIYSIHRCTFSTGFDLVGKYCSCSFQSNKIMQSSTRCV